jgi:[ribosomal protein S5]-alanine N-acetyltransferase
MQATQIIFETERLIVRHYNDEDADNFFLLNADPEVMRYIRPVRNRPDTDQFFAEVIQYSKDNPAYGRMAAIEKKSGAFVGSFAIIPLEKTVHMQLGYSLLPNHWGKGYGTELVRAGLAYIFTQTNLDEIFGVTESSNWASQHVLLKSGFTPHSTVMEGEKELNRFNFLKQNFNR